MTTWLTHRPSPLKDGIADEYWAAAAAGRLVLQRCDRCDRHHFPPRVRCPRCWSASALSWADADGRGVVHAFSVVHRPPTPDFNDGRPYVVALVDLAEGVRMMSNVVGCDIDAVHIGMPVTVGFDEGPDGPLPVFVPASAPAPEEETP